MGAVYIVGTGMGTAATMTAQAAEIIAESDCLIGAKRVLEGIKNSSAVRFAQVLAADIAKTIEENKHCRQIVVVMSGDSGFFSGTKKLLQLLKQKGIEAQVICGISSLQYFCSKIQTSWDDVALCSVHGREENPIAPVLQNRKTFFLTGSNCTVEQVCQQLGNVGLGELQAWAGENLSYPHERIVCGKVRELAEQKFESLAVLLVENPSPCPPATHLPDSAFQRGDVPMTKEEVRAVSVAKLRLQPWETVYDVGAGTGSVTAEIALHCPGGHVYGIEKNKEALSLLQQNKEALNLHHLHIISAKAPEGMEQLPPPDAVFIGGSSGQLQQIMSLCLEKNSEVRFVINAITLETVAEAVKALEQLDLTDTEIVQLTVAKAKKAGPYHMMMGQNPVYIISGKGRGGSER